MCVCASTPEWQNGATQALFLPTPILSLIPTISPLVFTPFPSLMYTLLLVHREKGPGEREREREEEGGDRATEGGRGRERKRERGRERGGREGGVSE